MSAGIADHIWTWKIAALLGLTSDLALALPSAAHRLVDKETSEANHFDQERGNTSAVMPAQDADDGGAKDAQAEHEGQSDAQVRTPDVRVDDLILQSPSVFALRFELGKQPRSHPGNNSLISFERGWVRERSGVVLQSLNRDASLRPTLSGRSCGQLGRALAHRRYRGSASRESACRFVSAVWRSWPTARQSS